jgi:peptide/nickel transport system ATP-binding protein
MLNLLEVDQVSRRFALRGGRVLRAVDAVSLAVGAGESVGVVGESGSGKSTLSRMIVRLLDPTEGAIRFEGEPIGDVPAKRFNTHPLRSSIQMVFQDATDSLDPRLRVGESIAEPLRALPDLRGLGTAARRDRVHEAAAQVDLAAPLLDRYPHQLSGGQKARVGIARALVSRPRLLVLDEPTAALDVSVQATVLGLLARLQRELGLAMLFVSHDLNVVRLITRRVVVMRAGQVVESGPVDQVFQTPAHEYTRALVAAIPAPPVARLATREKH